MEEEKELLRRYADEKSQEAFSELVRRKVDLVYAAALRQTGGDAHLAQDVTQGVFLALARQASTLNRHAVLTGWLYTTTRYLATKAVRTQVRWQRREQEANTMNAILSEPEPAWNELRPVIDAAMHELGETDRAAVLLRYFEGLPLARVGATLGLNENAARMRVDRAIEKLRGHLAQRGITSTAAMLGTALAAQPAISAPVGLAAIVSESAVTSGATYSLASTLGLFMNTKHIVVAVCLLATAGLATYEVNQRKRDAKLATVSDVTVEPTQPLATLRADALALTPASPLPLVPPNLVPAASVANADVTALTLEQQQTAIMHNLRQISGARNYFLLEERRAPTLAELVGPDKLIKRLISVNGEDYSRIEFGDGKPLSVTTSDGATVTFESSFVDPPPSLYSLAPSADFPLAKSPALRAALEKALEAYRAAHNGRNPPEQIPMQLVPYFANTSDAVDFFEWWVARAAAKRAEKRE